MEIWPNFFIVGAPRAGTTSLYEYLKNIKGIFMSRVKETYFFSPNVNIELILSKPVQDTKNYLKLFHGVKNEKAIGEATPTYFWDPDSPRLIHEKIPNAQIIVILRNPVERAFSHYLWLVGLGKEKSSFYESIKNALNAKPNYSGRIIEGGLYSKQYEKYLKIFGKEKIKLIIFEEFSKNTRQILLEILKFLEVDSDPPEIFQKFNAYVEPRGKIAKNVIQNKFIQKIGSNLPRSIGSKAKTILDKESSKPEMPHEDRVFLENFYHDDTKNLEKILKRGLPWGI